MRSNYFNTIAILITVVLYLTTPFAAAAASGEKVKKSQAASLNITKIEPSSLQGQIATNSSFKIYFEKPLDASSITSRFITLSGAGKPVTVSFKYYKSSNCLFITPAALLEHDREYTLVIKTGLRGAKNERLKAAVMYQFYTAAAPDNLPIAVISTYPKNGSIINNLNPLIYANLNTAAHFNAKENTSDLKDYMSISSSSCEVQSRVRYDKASKKIELEPDSQLTDGEKYRVCISRKLRGSNKKCLYETYTWSFTAKKPRFFLTGSYPAKENSVINSYDKILLIFSEPLDPKTDFAEYIKIYDASSNILNGKYVLFNNKSLIFTPEFPFYPGKYRVETADTLKSYNCNTLDKIYIKNFSVGTDEYNVGEKVNEKNE